MLEAGTDLCAFNVSPKGDLEGVLLEVREGIVQVNFPKGANGAAERWKLGSTLTLRGVLEEDDFAHAWPERGILGTQLGPNENGRAW